MKFPSLKTFCWQWCWVHLCQKGDLVKLNRESIYFVIKTLKKLWIFVLWKVDQLVGLELMKLVKYKQLLHGEAVQWEVGLILKELHQNSLVVFSSVSCCVKLSKLIPRLATEINSVPYETKMFLRQFTNQENLQWDLVTHTVDFTLLSIEWHEYISIGILVKACICYSTATLSIDASRLWFRVLTRPFPKGTVPFGCSNVLFGSVTKEIMLHLKSNIFLTATWTTSTLKSVLALIIELSNMELK